MSTFTEFTLATGARILNAAHVVSVQDGPDNAGASALVRMVNGDQWAVRGTRDNVVAQLEGAS